MLYTQNRFDRFYEELDYIDDQKEREGRALMMAFRETETEQLRMEFGLNTGHAAEDFAGSFNG